MWTQFQINVNSMQNLCKIDVKSMRNWCKVDVRREKHRFDIVFTSFLHRFISFLHRFYIGIFERNIVSASPANFSRGQVDQKSRGKRARNPTHAPPPSRKVVLRVCRKFHCTRSVRGRAGWGFMIPKVRVCLDWSQGFWVSENPTALLHCLPVLSVEAGHLGTEQARKQSAHEWSGSTQQNFTERGIRKDSKWKSGVTFSSGPTPFLKEQIEVTKKVTELQILCLAEAELQSHFHTDPNAMPSRDSHFQFSNFPWNFWRKKRCKIDVSLISKIKGPGPLCLKNFSPTLRGMSSFPVLENALFLFGLLLFSRA